jgi:DNA gyrase subunit A
VATELDAVAEQFGTHRRTLLLNAAPPKARTTKSAAELQLAYAPTTLLLSTTGRAVRVDLEPGANIATPARRSKHDAIQARLETTTRSEIGAVTSAGRVVRFTPIDIPAVPASSVGLGAGVRIHDYLGLTDRSERVLALIRFDDDTPLALGTKDGVVKRIVPSALAVRPEIEIIGLKPKDVVIGAAPASDETELVFVSSDAQLLHFPASNVRPQGAPAGGMAGVKLGSGAEAISFTVVASPEEAVVVTVSGSEGMLAGADAGRAKVSDFAEFPGKGRATGGVRAHAFLKGEDRLRLAWVGVEPRAIGADGAARQLPASGSKRDASGQPLDSVIGSVGTAIG